MSLLIVAPLPPGAEDSAEARAARASAERQSFDAPQAWRWSGGCAWLYPTPRQPARPAATAVSVQQGERFALALGSFHWRGRGPQATLEALLAMDTPLPSLPWDTISGAFLLLLVRPDGVWLAGDALGLMKIYQLAGETDAAPARLYSSSLLACCAALRQPSLHRRRAQEYVLLGANHGLQTPIDGVRLLDPTQAVELRQGRLLGLHAPGRLLQADAAGPSSPEQAAHRLSEALATEFAELVRAHGGPVAMALSGGFDSRLLLAALRQAGHTPDLFVYGRPQDEDVVIAQAVARRLGLPIEHIDKSGRARAMASLDNARLRANLGFFDGLPVDGVFDRGVDAQTRHQQVQDGRLNLNGGGGEILRNFFYLPDRPYSAEQVCATFYSGWQPQVFPTPDERAAFLHMVQDELLAALGRPGGDPAARRAPLPRAEVELLYTLFRLRYWMGRNNSLATRYGAFMTPLVTPRLVREAALLPLRWKDFGRLEAAVIRRLAPDVAAGPSAYGFSFADGPGLGHRVRTTGTLLRPAWLRAHSQRVQALLGRVAAPAVPDEWVQALGEAPRTDLVRLEALTGQDQLNRLMTLQALLRELDAAPPPSA